MVNVLIFIGFVAGFLMAVAIGANDAANSMATAVGAKAITPRQAVIIAGVLEFLGATFFGKQVMETIRKGIVDPGILSSADMVVVGAISALLGAAVWIAIATRYGLPVSTTHSIVGSMIGYGVAAAGFMSVNWAKVGEITLSWVISPFVGMIFAYLLFKLIARTILWRPSDKLSVMFLAPFYVSVAFFVIGVSFSAKVLHKGLAPSSFWWGLGFMFIGFLTAYLYARKVYGEYDDPYKRIEEVFRLFQVFTSSYVALAHGANDVANAIAPVAAIYSVWKFGATSSHAEIPRWILAFGGLGIAIGVYLFGRKVMETVGGKLTELTNTRGFTIDFSAASVVFGASLTGMPISTTHTVVGAVLGVGFARGVGAVNLGLLGEIVLSWFLTVPAAAIISFVIFKILGVIFL